MPGYRRKPGSRPGTNTNGAGRSDRRKIGPLCIQGAVFCAKNGHFSAWEAPQPSAKTAFQGPTRQKRVVFLPQKMVLSRVKLGLRFSDNASERFCRAPPLSAYVSILCKCYINYSFAEGMSSDTPPPGTPDTSTPWKVPQSFPDIVPNYSTSRGSCAQGKPGRSWRLM